jgi:elongation factor P
LSRIKEAEAIMLPASQIRTGMAIRYETRPYRVLAAEYHPGQGKMGGVLHARLKNLETGTLWEHSFRAELKLEDLPVEKRPLTFLYADTDSCHFMDPESYDQIPVPVSVIGDTARFLRPDMTLSVEFVGGTAVGILFPEVIEVRVCDTAPPLHNQQDSTWKPARLDNGIEIMVPQFIKASDTIRLDVENLKYMDRAKGAGK